MAVQRIIGSNLQLSHAIIKHLQNDVYAQGGGGGWNARWSLLIAISLVSFSQQAMQHWRYKTMLKLSIYIHESYHSRSLKCNLLFQQVQIILLSDSRPQESELYGITEPCKTRARIPCLQNTTLTSAKALHDCMLPVIHRKLDHAALEMMCASYCHNLKLRLSPADVHFPQAPSEVLSLSYKASSISSAARSTT